MGFAGGYIKTDIDVRGEKVLQKLPDELRVKYVRRALRMSAKIVGEEARKNVTQLKAERRPRFGKASPTVNLRRSIKWRLGQSRRSELQDSAVIETTHGAQRYAAPVEFGHQMFLFGRRTDKRVQARPFMRPAINSTRRTRDMIFWKILRELV